MEQSIGRGPIDQLNRNLQSTPENWYILNDTEPQKNSLISVDCDNEENESHDLNNKMLNTTKKIEHINENDCTYNVSSTGINLTKNNTNHSPCFVHKNTLIKSRSLANFCETTVTENDNLEIELTPYKLNIQKSFAELSEGNFFGKILQLLNI